jgi:thiol-disulfide isomerase/thioredoxin
VNKKVFIPIIGVLLLALAVGIYYLNFKVGDKPEEENSIANEDNVDENNGQKEDEPSSQEEEDFYPDIAVGELAPDFTLVDLDGKEVSLSDFRGKYVLINFWATWCQYCDLEMPDLDRLYKENEDLVVLAVNVQEEKGVVEDYIKKGGYTFPVVLDEEGYVSLTYLVSSYPTSYFVDKEGILLGGVPGMMTYEQMVQILENIRNN